MWSLEINYSHWKVMGPVVIFTISKEINQRVGIYGVLESSFNTALGCRTACRGRDEKCIWIEHVGGKN